MQFKIYPVGWLVRNQARKLGVVVRSTRYATTVATPRSTRAYITSTLFSATATTVAVTVNFQCTPMALLWREHQPRACAGEK
jgi:hypothetical protein